MGGVRDRRKEERRETVGFKCQEINPTLEFKDPNALIEIL